MLKTNGDFVSEIRNHLKALSKDDYISARYILSVAYTYIQYIISTRPLSKIMRDISLFTFVSCVEMKKVKKHECGIIEFRVCDNIMVSKEELPDIFSADIGFIIESITNIDNSVEYRPLRSPSDYAKSKKREFGKKFQYYYISNKRLYLLNSSHEIVNINALFLDEQAAKLLSECEKDCDECDSKLDNKFPCPEEFLSTVRDQTLQLLLGGHKQVVKDENPDMDSNQKSRTA
jgi:hypothetical protein